MGSEVQRGLQSIVQNVQVASDLHFLSLQYNTRVVKESIRCKMLSIDYSSSIQGHQNK